MNMFALGFLRGAILGVSFGLMSIFISKEICKKNNRISKNNKDKK
tara:strand:- start:154 stop:288 length:135 start_codon:yes stop_codon:yes gene_type:complete